MTKNNNNWEKNIFVGYCPMLDSVILTHSLSYWKDPRTKSVSAESPKTK